MMFDVMFHMCGGSLTDLCRLDVSAVEMQQTLFVPNNGVIH